MTGITYPSPFGPISLRESGGVLTHLRWRHADCPASPLIAEALAQIAAYFDGRLQVFDLPLDYGSGLQEKVRRAMAAIPFGETRSYGELSTALGTPARGIGQACGANPLPILIPCHRVLGRRTLGGFSAPGGVETKVALLRHEGAAGLLI